MINVETQCCGLVLIWLVTFFYSRFPKLDVRTTKVFGRLMVYLVFAAAADIASVAAIYYSDYLPDILVDLVCKLYLIFLLTVMFSSFLYICADVYRTKQEYGKVTAFFGVCCFIAAALVAVLPIHYVCEEDGSVIYSYGPSTLATYITFGIMMLVMFGHIFIGRKTMQPRRKLALKIWLVIWLASAAIQFLNNSLLIASFAGCVGVLIIFLMIENPELNLDSASGFFHTGAMPRYVDELFGDKQSFFMINTHFMTENTEFFEGIGNSAVFVGGGEIYLFFDDEEAFGAALSRISDEFDKQPVYYLEDYTIVNSADELMHILKAAQQYVKKDNPTNLYPLDADFKNRMEERAATVQLIQDAIAENRVETFFQPIYSITSEKYNSAEALARIRGKDGELIPPYRFIPVAEEDGSIIQLGKIIFENVCRFLKETENDIPGLKYIEVNLSVIQGEDRKLAEDVITIMKKYGINMDKINLEITESASLSGREQLLDNMTILIREGIEFSLDDFGTGQSNLDYMSTMPVQLVKFDRSMTQSFFVSEKTKCVMTAAVNMIHEMGMKIVVEGIETKEQLESMKKLGADYIQGYFFSKPLPQDEFIAFLKNNN